MRLLVLLIIFLVPIFSFADECINNPENLSIYFIENNAKEMVKNNEYKRKFIRIYKWAIKKESWERLGANDIGKTTPKYGEFKNWMSKYVCTKDSYYTDRGSFTEDSYHNLYLKLFSSDKKAGLDFFELADTAKVVKEECTPGEYNYETQQCVKVVFNKEEVADNSTEIISEVNKVKDELMGKLEKLKKQDEIKDLPKLIYDTGVGKVSWGSSTNILMYVALTILVIITGTLVRVNLFMKKALKRDNSEETLQQSINGCTQTLMKNNTKEIEEKIVSTSNEIKEVTKKTESEITEKLTEINNTFNTLSPEEIQKTINGMFEDIKKEMKYFKDEAKKTKDASKEIETKVGDHIENIEQQISDYTEQQTKNNNQTKDELKTTLETELNTFVTHIDTAAETYTESREQLQSVIDDTVTKIDKQINETLGSLNESTERYTETHSKVSEVVQKMNELNLENLKELAGFASKLTTFQIAVFSLKTTETFKYIESLSEDKASLIDAISRFGKMEGDSYIYLQANSEKWIKQLRNEHMKLTQSDSLYNKFSIDLLAGSNFMNVIEMIEQGQLAEFIYKCNTEEKLNTFFDDYFSLNQHIFGTAFYLENVLLAACPVGTIRPVEVMAEIFRTFKNMLKEALEKQNIYMHDFTLGQNVFGMEERVTTSGSSDRIVSISKSPEYRLLYNDWVSTTFGEKANNKDIVLDVVYFGFDRKVDNVLVTGEESSIFSSHKLRI